MEWETLILPSLTLLIGAMAAYGMTWLGKSKQRIELGQKEDLLVSELRSLKLQVDIDEQRRVLAVAAALKTADTVTSMAAEQAKMANILDLTHIATNSGKTALEALLQGVRGELKAAEQGAAQAALLAAAELRAAKELAHAEKRLAEQRIDDLQRQLTSMALTLPPSPPVGPAPIPVVLTDAAGQPAPLPLQVEIAP